MVQQQLNGFSFAQMVSAGARHLVRMAKKVDALNVFPVPDGDTGTNMSLTFSAGSEEMTRRQSEHIGQTASALSRGLLMGARGNSGVILSQLFRGLAKEIREKEVITVREFAKALQRGVDTAYKAVIKPVEGTILTVAREAAKHGTTVSSRVEDFVSLMEEVVQAAKKSLANTPELLPVLKQTGVVDAGGQGLVYIYEGFLAGLTGEREPEADEEDSISIDSLTELAHRQSAQAHLATEDIAFGYCTEFIVQTSPATAVDFNEDTFREACGAYGDSLLVVRDDDLVKVHIHTEEPLKLLDFATQYGDIRTAKIENMREQHRAIVGSEAEETAALAARDDGVEKAYGIVAVAMGKGTAEIFRSLGVDYVLEGGQTMNPSTDMIVKAMNDIRAKQYIILPNNGNVVMAAEQAAAVAEQPVTVIPSKSVPQGLSAMLAFNADASSEENWEAMCETIENVKSGQVTYAVRDTEVDGMTIKEGDFLGIADGEIKVSHPDMAATAESLLLGMVDDNTEIVTILFGQDVTNAQAASLGDAVTDKYPDVEVEIHNGEQPLYYYLFAVE